MCDLSFRLCLLLFDVCVTVPVLVSVSVTVTVFVEWQLDLPSVSPSVVSVFLACHHKRLIAKNWKQHANPLALEYIMWITSLLANVSKSCLNILQIKLHTL